MASPTVELADIRLGDDGPLAAFVARQRSAGLSWRAVADELNRATGGSVRVSHEALRVWFPEASS